MQNKRRRQKGNQTQKGNKSWKTIVGNEQESWSHCRRLLLRTEGHPGTKAWSGGFGVAEPAGGLARLLHPCPSFPWVLLVVTNQLEWLLLRRILSLRWLPSIHRSPPCLMDCSAKVVEGVCVCACVCSRPQAPPPPPPLPITDYSVYAVAVTSPWHWHLSHLVSAPTLTYSFGCVDASLQQYLLRLKCISTVPGLCALRCWQHTGSCRIYTKRQQDFESRLPAPWRI